jgi:hypothetical protein
VFPLTEGFNIKNEPGNIKVFRFFVEMRTGDRGQVTGDRFKSLVLSPKLDNEPQRRRGHRGMRV